jgi:hypothetical protein
VIITAVSPTDVFFNYDRGMGNAKLKDLPPGLQKHFHYDPDAVQKTGLTAYHFRVVSGSDRPVNPADIKTEWNDAITKVKLIINQPVPRFTATDDMSVSVFQPGWFHPGAIRPDFKTVDIRASQDLMYGKSQYVSSNLNPGLAFRGADLEFNAMTKYFYTDRSLPKKKLTQAEMLEINRLYRIIGDDEDRMNPSAN